jgi:3-deoxy-7-phosphoheptulonate synthase
MQLPTPALLKAQLPPPAFALKARKDALDIFSRKDERLAAIVGPCSIHDQVAALEYALKLKRLKNERLFPIMRVFIEKPRTVLGWKGFVYDPKLNGSNDLALGLRQARALMIEILQLEVPIAVELLDPLIAPYFDDLITWGFIGARTSASQPHRQMVSNLSFPVGFKNDCQGRTDEAEAALIAARSPHSYFGIDAEGRISKVLSKGNPFTHLVLRGGYEGPNYEKARHFAPHVIIDCAHGNCEGDFRKQKEVLYEAISMDIAGFMLESNLFEGKQSLSSFLSYGVSITDACLSWEETETLLNSLDQLGPKLVLPNLN